MKEKYSVLIAFIILGVIWGHAFLFIKLASYTFSPLGLLSIRLFFGLLTLYFLIKVKRISIPWDIAIWKHFLFMGIFGVTLPAILLNWSISGVHGLDSSIAAVINSTTPMFSLIISTLILRIERLSWLKVYGAIISFGGILILLGNSFSSESKAGLLQYLAVILASISYATGFVYSARYMHHISPLLKAFGQILTASLITWLLALFLDSWTTGTFAWSSIFALLWLGCLASGIGYNLLFYIIGKWGAVRASLIGYLCPLIAVVSGNLILEESINWRIIVGGTSIIMGISLSQKQKKRRKNVPPPLHH